MKINNNVYLMFLAFLIIGIGCSDDPIIEKAESDLFNVAGATISVTGVSGAEYDLSDADMTPISFTVNTAGESVSSVDMFVSHNGGTPVQVKSITSFPSTESYNVSEAAAAAGLSLADIALGDVFNFSFDNTSTGSGTYSSGSGVGISVIESAIPFKSALAGVFDAKTTVTNQDAMIDWDNCGANEWTGTVEWVALHTDPDADGSYTVLTTASSGEQFDDISHGAYYGCYGTDAQSNLPNNGMDGDLLMSDVDGKISMPGASQWGEVYSIGSLSVDGAVLTFSWTNDYGEGATVELTRTDGENWPDNLTN